MGHSIAVGFIGGGKMATALIQGMVRGQVARADEILAADPSAEARERLLAKAKCGVTADGLEVVRAAPRIVLAVHPQVVRATLAPLAAVARADQVWISLAPGIGTREIAELLGGKGRIVRVMPNTPCLVEQGASAYCLGASASAQDAEWVARMLGAVGRAFLVAESAMDAVTGLSGSGPAYIYLAIEALADGGVKMGLARDLALALAAQTVLGAAHMVLDTGLHPGALKDMVASPGGTTIAGLHALEKAGLRGALMSAVEAATLRARELGR